MSVSVVQKIALPGSIVSATAQAVARSSERQVLTLFQSAAARVPAYRDFLRTHGISPALIRTTQDLCQVPPVTKANYLLKYPFEALCWDGTLKKKAYIYTATSGSTRQPFYFPRGEGLDYRSSLMHELFLKTVSRGRPQSTLVIVSFGMGVWIGGLITYQAFRYLAKKGYAVSVITPGSNKKEVIEALVRLAPKYDQAILCGYPPFVKDVLEEAPSHGFDPSRTPLKLLFAAEAFSETFRNMVMRLAGTVEPSMDTANIYGSADLGTMAMETPLTIHLRRRSLENPALYSALFSEATRLPTLAQFHPAIAHFDQQEGQLLVTGDNEMPLVRYAIGDRGGVLSYEEAMAAGASADPDFSGAMRKARIAKTLLPLPLVYVYERADFSVKLFGAIIYAEHVRAAFQSPELSASITGKFSMTTRHDERENEYLEVDVELKPGVGDGEALRGRIRDALVAALKQRNAEYQYLWGSLGERVLPRIVCWQYEHPDRFRPGAKQRWVR